MTLTPIELAEALRDAARVAHGDRGHDLSTALDVLAQDHRPELRDVAVQQQLAYAVAYFADRGSRAQRPVDVAADWCAEHGARLEELLRATADSVERQALPAAA